uniref:BHLH domain-containing protein n=1 Tax=Tetranychus urticae TaxID=32264 RepID=T1K8I2_TETUR
MISKQLKNLGIMTTIFEKSDSLKLIDVEHLETGTKKSLDTEVIYLNINDLTTEANNYADYNEDEVKLPYQLSYQLPSIEWLLRSDSVAYENLKKQSYKINGHLYESTSTTLTTSSKLSVATESIDLKSISTSIGSIDDLSTPTTPNPPLIDSQSTNFRNIIDNNCTDYNEDYDALETDDIVSNIVSATVNVDRRIEINNNHFNFHNLQLRNPFNNHHYHHLHAHYHHHHYFHRHQPPFNLPDVYSKMEVIPSTTLPSPTSTCSSSSTALEAIYQPPEVPSRNMPTSTSTTKNRKLRTQIWKKYSKKKNLSQDELERKRDLANQQERTRMHRQNDALKHLRNAIPYEFSRHPPEKNLSKIKTLRFAIEYIKELNSMLTRDNQ